MWYNQYGDEFETEEEAREDMWARMRYSDIEEYGELDIEEMLKELARLNSPLFYGIVEKAEESYWQENYHQDEE